MRHLKDADGTAPHRRACQYHVTQCRMGTTPLHAQLASEGDNHLSALKQAARATEDAEDAATSAAARSDGAEIALENVLRDLHADAGKADREDPALNAQSSIFPGGLGEMIDPEGALQLAVMPAFHVRLTPFAGHAGLAATIAKLAPAEAAFQAAIADEETADKAVETAFQKELDARRGVREQLESAHGRLRDLYKARPKLADRFFIKDPGGRRSGKRAKPSDGATPAPAPPTPVTP